MNYLKKLFITLSLTAFVLVPVFSASAANLIPCGEDLNGDGKIMNVSRDGQVMIEECGFDQLVDLANRVIDFIIYLLISGSVIMFMYAGFLYITSYASEGNKSKAKGIFFKVLKGLGISLTAWLVVKFLVLGLGGSETTILWLLE